MGRARSAEWIFGIELREYRGIFEKFEVEKTPASRDTTAAAFLAEAGLSPFDVDDIVMVLRAFPIRVAGDSGPLPEETTWPEIASNGGYEEFLGEFTVPHFPPLN